jgi:hypothetical protein
MEAARSRPDRLALPALVALALGLRVWGIDHGLPWSVVQPDEENVVVRALRFGYGDLNPHWFLYPSLYLYATFALLGAYYAAGRALGGFASAEAFGAAFFADPTWFYVLPRLGSALLGALTLVPLYGAARALAGRRAALLACLFLAVSAYHVRESHSAKPDAAMIFLVVLSFYYAVRHAQDGRVTTALLAAAAAGLGVSTKYPAGVALLPLGLAILLRGERSLGRRAALGALAAAVAAAAFVAGTPFAVLDTAEFGRWVRFVLEHQEIVWRGQPDAGSGWTYYLLEALPASSGALLALAAPVGAALLVRGAPGAGALVLAFPVATYLALGRASLYLPNFFTPCVPFLALLAGIAADRGVQRLRALGPALVIVLVLPALYLTARLLFAFTVLDTAVVAKFWIEQHVPDGARIVFVRAAPPIDMAPAMLRRTLADDAGFVDRLRGFRETPTGRGAHARYLLAHPRRPAYEFVVLPLDAARDARSDGGFDARRWDGWEYLVELAPAGARGEWLPFDVHREPTPGERALVDAYRRFRREMAARASLVHVIDGGSAFSDVPAGTLRAALHRWWGRPGMRVSVYRLAPG